MKPKWWKKFIQRIGHKEIVVFYQISGSIAVFFAVLFLLLPERIPPFAMIGGVLGIISLLAFIGSEVYAKLEVHYMMREMDLLLKEKRMGHDHIVDKDEKENTDQ